MPLDNIKIRKFAPLNQTRGIKATLYCLMAEGHPPSPNCEDVSLSLGRLRVKPAMRPRGGSLFPFLKSRVP